MKKIDIESIVADEVDNIFKEISLKEFMQASDDGPLTGSDLTQFDVSGYTNQMLDNIKTCIKYRLKIINRFYNCSGDKPKQTKMIITFFEKDKNGNVFRINNEPRPGLTLLDGESWKQLSALAKKKGLEKKLIKNLNPLIRKLVKDISPKKSRFGIRIEGFRDFKLQATEDGLFASFRFYLAPPCAYFTQMTSKKYYKDGNEDKVYDKLKTMDQNEIQNTVTNFIIKNNIEKHLASIGSLLEGIAYSKDAKASPSNNDSKKPKKTPAARNQKKPAGETTAAGQQPEAGAANTTASPDAAKKTPTTSGSTSQSGRDNKWRATTTTVLDKNKNTPGFPRSIPELVKLLQQKGLLRQGTYNMQESLSIVEKYIIKEQDKTNAPAPITDEEIKAAILKLSSDSEGVYSAEIHAVLIKRSDSPPQTPPPPATPKASAQADVKLTQAQRGELAKLKALVIPAYNAAVKGKPDAIVSLQSKLKEAGIIIDPVIEKLKNAVLQQIEDETQMTLGQKTQKVRTINAIQKAYLEKIRSTKPSSTKVEKPAPTGSPESPPKTRQEQVEYETSGIEVKHENGKTTATASGQTVTAPGARKGLGELGKKLAAGVARLKFCQAHGEKQGIKDVHCMKKK